MTDLPWIAIVRFVEDPVDLLACMMVSKAVRKAAGRELNRSTTNAISQPETVAQKTKFAGFLNKPERFPGFKDEYHHFQYVRYSGPFRPNKIHQMSDVLAKNVIVLKYQSTYLEEDSAVAIVDDEGQLLAIYKFQSCKDYSMFCNCISRRDVTEGGSCFGEQLCTLPRITLTNSGALRPGVRPAENAWLFETATLKWVCKSDDEDFEMFDVAMPNIKLFRLFEGRLSPTEVATVLMHALSSDPTLIFAYAEAVYSHFEILMSSAVDREPSIQYDILHGPHYGARLESWGRELKNINYGTVSPKDEKSKKGARSKAT